MCGGSDLLLFTLTGAGGSGLVRLTPVESARYIYISLAWEACVYIMSNKFFSKKCECCKFKFTCPCPSNFVHMPLNELHCPSNVPHI